MCWIMLPLGCTSAKKKSLILPTPRNDFPSSTAWSPWMMTNPPPQVCAAPCRLKSTFSFVMKFSATCWPEWNCRVSFCHLFQDQPSVPMGRLKPGVSLSLFNVCIVCWVFSCASSCVNSSSVLWFGAADCEPAVHFINPARQSVAAPPAAGSSDDLMLMDCDVPQFPQPVNVPLPPQLPLPPPIGELRESRGFESLQSSLSTLPGKLANPILFLPLEKFPTCSLSQLSPLNLLGCGNYYNILGTFHFSGPTAFTLCKSVFFFFCDFLLFSFQVVPPFFLEHCCKWRRRRMSKGVTWPFSRTSSAQAQGPMMISAESGRMLLEYLNPPMLHSQQMKG